MKKLLILISLTLGSFSGARPPVDLVVPQGRSKEEGPFLREADLVFTETPRKREKILLVKKDTFLHIEPDHQQVTKTRFKKGMRLKFLKISGDHKWAQIQSEDGVYEGWVNLSAVSKYKTKK